MMIKPMLAVPMAKGKINDWNDWAIEKKWDGHRRIVEVGTTSVKSWTRPRKHAGAEGKTMEARDLPPHLVRDFLNMPPGTYDGELMAMLPDGTWGTATDVTRLDLQDRLVFVVFDLLEVDRHVIVAQTYDARRAQLVELFDGEDHMGAIVLASSLPLTCKEDAETFVKAVWELDKGEGAIIKRRAATYQAGTRSPDFIKVKRCQHACLRVVGFEPTKGKVLQRGAYASVILEDEQGIRTSCKTLNDEEIAMFEKEAVSAYAKKHGVHPSIGRRLWIEFPMRTRTGNYQGPIMWDRWAEEGE